MTKVVHTYQVGWRLHNKEQMEKETVKLFDFGKLLSHLKKKYGVSTKTCAELIIHEIMPDGTVTVRLEHEEGKPTKVRGSTVTYLPATKYPTPSWADMTEETLKEIGEALTPPVKPIDIPRRIAYKNRKALTE